MKEIIRNSYLYIIIGLISISCSDFYQDLPAEEIFEEEVLGDVSRNRNLINPAYGGVRNSPWVSLDYFTDNAVSSQGAQRAAVSGATSESSPVAGEWNRAFGRIIHINFILENGFGITFNANDSAEAVTLETRARGEAYGLRAYYKWILLKNFAGPSAKDPSVMLGIPILDSSIVTSEAANLARSTYAKSFESILSDLDSADKYIEEMRYAGGSTVNGVLQTGRVSGEMILALRARIYLFAASPAYEHVTWQEAAMVAYDAIKQIDNEVIIPLQPYGDYDDTNAPDALWRSAFTNNGLLERLHFPPSMFGQGNCNPSHNLVESFPTSEGYPIDHTNSNFDSLDPYNGRDLRLERFIFTNGFNNFEAVGVQIETFIGGADAHGGVNLRGTRTGYYMKKFMSSTINFTPGVNGQSSDFKFNSVYTREGLYLDFAEAASEAFGPMALGPEMAITAVEALQAIRVRAGFLIDDYLNNEAANDADLFRELVRNERRLELAFTGERYYDVRRWLEPMNELEESVQGVKIEKAGLSSFSYTPEDIEGRNFENYMYYNPIPRSEILKSNALVQNAGWE